MANQVARPYVYKVTISLIVKEGLEVWEEITIHSDLPYRMHDISLQRADSFARAVSMDGEYTLAPIHSNPIVFVTYQTLQFKVQTVSQS